MRRLNEQEVALLDAVDPLDARRARIAHSKLMPPGVSGITFGSLVVIRSGTTTTNRPDLFMHELIHVEQYRIHNTFGFLARYVRDYLVNLWHLRNHREAYLAIAFEREARDRVRSWTERRHSS